MIRIQFYYSPTNLAGVEIRPSYDLQDDFLRRILTTNGRQKIELNWKAALRGSNKLWRGELGALVDTQEGTLRYAHTDYAEWRAIAFPDLPPQDVTLSDIVYETYRVSAVGIVVRTDDNKIIVHKKPSNVPAGGKLDSSANGFCEVRNGLLNFEQAAYEKLSRELGLTEEDIISLELTGVHGVVGKNSYCSSGMLDYHARTRLSYTEIMQRANSNYIADLIPVDIERLADFIVLHYLDGSLIGDGCAALLSSLDSMEFTRTVKTLTSDSKAIEFGILKEGIFIPNS